MTTSNELIDLQVDFGDVSVTVLDTQYWRDIISCSNQIEISDRRIVRFKVFHNRIENKNYPVIISISGDPGEPFLQLKSFSKMLEKLNYQPKYQNNVYEFRRT